MNNRVLKSFIFLILLIFISFLSKKAVFSQEIPVKFNLSSNSSTITSNNVISVAGSYQPYHSIIIKSEVNGRIVKMNIDEGEIIPKGKVCWYIDCNSLKEQARQIEDSLDLLKKEHKILADILKLRKRTLHRYQILYKQHKIPEQTLENIQLEYLANLNNIIINEQQQHQLIQNLIKIKDLIKKSMPSFNQSYYVSELYHYTNEYVNIGEPIVKLLDISKARVRLILSPKSFIKLRDWIKSRKHLICFIKKDQGNKWLKIKDFRFERMKIDPATGYLYSYSVDLVFKPIPNWLWGQVVKVRLVYSP